jgi:hypothetical protein
LQFSVYSIYTIFILGDGLTHLLLRWETPAAALGKIFPIFFCSWIFFG